MTKFVLFFFHIRNNNILVVRTRETDNLFLLYYSPFIRMIYAHGYVRVCVCTILKRPNDVKHLLFICFVIANTHTRIYVENIYIYICSLMSIDFVFIFETKNTKIYSNS